MRSIHTFLSFPSFLICMACSGEVEVDTGTSDSDSGTSESDSGTSESDSGTSPTDTWTDDSGSDDISAEDYRNPGPYSVQSITGQEATGSCDMSFTLYTPNGVTDAPLVLLAHGFVRSQENMSGWAEHFASWGFQVATPEMCHLSIWDADHSTNADDLVALGQAMSNTSVIYAGQSAGGLAATLAAGRDQNSLGALGLDATDSESLGAGEANRISAPVYGLAGEPSDCNAANNGLSIYSAINEAHVLRVTEADHCDFESDTDVLCTAFCQGSNNQFDDNEIHSTILGLSTAALLDMAGQSQAGRAWWSVDGEYYAELNASGIITNP